MTRFSPTERHRSTRGWRFRLAAAVPLGLAVLSGCAAPQAGGPGAVAPAAPHAALEAYVGHYPFDVVKRPKGRGTSWNADPAVVAAVRAAVPDATVRDWVLGGRGPATPIGRVDGKIASWACEAHNCGPHQWITLIDPATGAAQVCYFDMDTAPERTRWFSGGREEVRDERTAPCPSVPD